MFTLILSTYDGPSELRSQYVFVTMFIKNFFGSLTSPFILQPPVLSLHSHEEQVPTFGTGRQRFELQ